MPLVHQRDQIHTDGRGTGYPIFIDGHLHRERVTVRDSLHAERASVFGSKSEHHVTVLRQIVRDA